MTKATPTRMKPTPEPEDLVRVADDFLTAAACEDLLAEAQRGRWVSSQTEGRTGSLQRSGRVSESLELAEGFGSEGFSRRAANRLRRIEAKLAERFGVSPDCLEPWQMVRYRRGGSYDYHLDCGAWGRHPSGERAQTLMLILEQPARGGSTHFRALGQTILPLAGRLVVWRNLLPNGSCNHAMIHSGRPVWAGNKTILITWERERPFIHI